MSRLATTLIAALAVTTSAMAGNLSITAEPYMTGGLFTKPLLPKEGQDVLITVRAECSGHVPAGVEALLTIRTREGDQVTSEKLSLSTKGSCAEANYTWSSDENGLYTVRVVLDSENKLAEQDEGDNAAEIVLPVIVNGKCRDLHFPWYREYENGRWSTCVTSAGTEPEEYQRLAERGVIPLHWAPGKTSYDSKRAETHPEEVLDLIEEQLFQRYASKDNTYGCGIDEVGGYPGTFGLRVSIAAMEALARARRETLGKFYAVWNCGGTRPQLAAVCRRAADVYLLETYLWRALPEELGAVDIYEWITSRIEPVIRSSDMFQPAYGNHCYTLIGLDNTERPDRTDLGELENVIRFIRREFPEMRGVAWYNGSTQMEKTEANLAKMEEVKAASDRLCFEYWIRPCVTFLQGSLWLTRNSDGQTHLAGADGEAYLGAAVSNIGSIDSGEVVVEFLLDGERVGTQSASSVPAEDSRYESLVTLKQPIAPEAGPHSFKARILSAAGATVLDPSITLEQFVSE